MSYEAYMGEPFTMERREEIANERLEVSQAYHRLDRFSEMPLQCEDCKRIEEPGESFEDDWVSDVLCRTCIETRMANEEIF